MCLFITEEIFFPLSLFISTYVEVYYTVAQMQQWHPVAWPVNDKHMSVVPLGGLDSWPHRSTE